MKLKKFIVSLVVILMAVMCLNSVNAADVSVTLTPSTTTVKPGETFSVKVAAKNSDGIAAISTEIQYDETILELLNGTVTDQAKWVSYGEKPEKIEVLVNDGSNVTEADIYTLTFKVKQGAKTGNTIINATEVTIDSNASSNSISKVNSVLTMVNVSEGGAITIGGQATLTNIAIKTPPTKTTYNAGEKFSTSGMVVKAVYSDGTEKEITDYKYSPSGELSTSSNKITITYTENGVTKTATQNITIKSPSTNKDGEEIKQNITNNTSKDNTVAKNEIADTGLEDNITLIMAVVAIIGIASYIQYQKYNKF